MCVLWRPLDRTSGFIFALFTPCEGQLVRIFHTCTVCQYDSLWFSVVQWRSRFSTWGLLNRAAKFTCGGQGLLLFALEQNRQPGRPPTGAVWQHVRGKTKSSWNNKLLFCQAGCTQNKRDKPPRRRRDVTNGSLRWSASFQRMSRLKLIYVGHR